MFRLQALQINGSSICSWFLLYNWQKKKQYYLVKVLKIVNTFENAKTEI